MMMTMMMMMMMMRRRRRREREKTKRKQQLANVLETEPQSCINLPFYLPVFSAQRLPLGYGQYPPASLLLALQGKAMLLT